MHDESITAATQRVYNAVARRNPALTFLNYGYAEAGTAAVEMDEAAVIAASRRLYDAVLAGLESADRIVEVGCGRGAGAAHVLETCNIGHYVGIDLSDEHLRLCRERLQDRSRVQFVLADARRLPLRDASCDAAFSVEAAQHFEERLKCYREVARVLRPGGRFYLASIWHHAEIEPPALFAECGLRVVAQDDISAQVVRSLDLSTAYRQGIVDSLAMPERLTPMLLSFVGMRGCDNYEGLASGRLVYGRLVLERVG